MGPLSSGKKWREHEDINPPTCAQVKYALNCTFISSCVYDVVLNKKRDIFTFCQHVSADISLCLAKINARILTCTKTVSSQLIFEVFMALRINILVFWVITLKFERNMLPSFAEFSPEHRGSIYFSEMPGYFNIVSLRRPEFRLYSTFCGHT